MMENLSLGSNQIQDTLQQELLKIQDLLSPCFERPETYQCALSYLEGLISPVDRKNSWQLAEQAGHANPYAFQYLLGRAIWSPELLRDALRRYVAGILSQEKSVLSIDETGFLKKGQHSVGVGRQYSGTAGRIENCQIGVFLSYAGPEGRALIDRELYIPQNWFQDPERCRKAGVPAERSFLKKPALAKMMLQRAFEEGLKPAWVVGDEVYGCWELREYLETCQQPYVLAVASNSSVWLGFQQYRAKELWENTESAEWTTVSAGLGSKGERYYQWHRRVINSLSPAGWQRWLLMRRSLIEPAQVAFYIAYAPEACSLTDMAQAAGSRWTIEECFEMAKGSVGLDQYEVRSWEGWYRHITFSMLALALLTKLRQSLNKEEQEWSKKKS